MSLLLIVLRGCTAERAAVIADARRLVLLSNLSGSSVVERNLDRITVIAGLVWAICRWLRLLYKNQEVTLRGLAALLVFRRVSAFRL